MSKYKLTELVWEVVNSLLKDFDSAEEIIKRKKTHVKKVHFIPIQYRIFNGILQALNIRFGDFLEKFVKKILDKNTDYQVLDFKKTPVRKAISDSEQKIIDHYLKQQEITTQKPSLKNFNKLLQTDYSQTKINATKRIDVDLAFQKNNDIYLVEIKYEDNHDTGKLPSIYRKILETYFSLRRHYQNKYKIHPFLFYFLERKRWDSIYMVEKVNVLRGEQFWKKFTNVDFAEIKKCFDLIANNKEILQRFDKLKTKVESEIKK